MSERDSYRETNVHYPHGRVKGIRGIPTDVVVSTCALVHDRVHTRRSAPCRCHSQCRQTAPAWARHNAMTPRHRSRHGPDSTPSASRNGTSRSVEVPAPRPTAVAVEPRTLDAEIVGAGRCMGVDRSSGRHLDDSDGRRGRRCRRPRAVRRRGGADRPAARQLRHEVRARAADRDRLRRRLRSATSTPPSSSYVPELSGSGYDQVTVRQVLTMTSGVEWREDYHDPDSVASRFVRRWRERRGGTRDGTGRDRAEVEPGSRYTYCSPDSHGSGLGA